MIAGSKPLARAWLIVGLLWFVAALNYLDRNMITTMRASLVGAIPMTDAQFGLLTSTRLGLHCRKTMTPITHAHHGLAWSASARRAARLH